MGCRMAFPLSHLVLCLHEAHVWKEAAPLEVFLLVWSCRASRARQVPKSTLSSFLLYSRWPGTLQLGQNTNVPFQMSVGFDQQRQFDAILWSPCRISFMSIIYWGRDFQNFCSLLQTALAKLVRSACVEWTHGLLVSGVLFWTCLSLVDLRLCCLLGDPHWIVRKEKSRRLPEAWHRTKPLHRERKVPSEVGFLTKTVAGQKNGFISKLDGLSGLLWGLLRR